METPVHLGLDTASHDVTVCAIRGDRVEGARVELGQASAHLLRAIDDVLVRLDARPSHLAAVACTSGPGSFTGIRIGLATALGLAEGLDLPAVAVSNHWAQAWAVHGAGAQGAVCSILPSHGGRWSVQRFRLDDDPRAESAIDSVEQVPLSEPFVTSQGACRRHLDQLGLTMRWVGPLAEPLARLASTASEGHPALHWDRSTLLQPVYGAGPAVATPPRVSTRRA